jgi:hypothetical protein
VEEHDPGGNPRFFLPIGSAAALEEEVFCLAELHDEGYSDVMTIPWSRRKRLVERKMLLERKRESAAKQAAQAAARRARRSR